MEEQQEYRWFTEDLYVHSPFPVTTLPGVSAPRLLSAHMQLSHSVVFDVLQHVGLEPAKLLCPWDFPGRNTGLGCHFLLQRIFLTQESYPCLLHCQWIL